MSCWFPCFRHPKKDAKEQVARQPSGCRSQGTAENGVLSKQNEWQPAQQYCGKPSRCCDQATQTVPIAIEVEVQAVSCQRNASANINENMLRSFELVSG